MKRILLIFFLGLIYTFGHAQVPLVQRLGQDTLIIEGNGYKDTTNVYMFIQGYQDSNTVLANLGNGRLAFMSMAGGGPHTHTIGQVTGLQTALDGKASTGHNHNGVYSPVGHGHAVSDITNLQTLLDGKAATSHTHGQGDITNLIADLSEKADADHNHDGFYSLINHDHNSLYAALNHNHDAAYAALNHNHNSLYAIIAHHHDTVYAAIDHDHDGVYQPAGSYAASSHGHAISEITNLQTTLDGKAASNHNHDAAYSAINHNHDADYSDINHNHNSDYLDIDATTSDIEEGTNQYFTQARARGAISLTTTGSGAATYNSTTGVLNIPIAGSGGSESTAWGNIPGTLSDQTDLQTALDGKSDVGHDHDADYAAIDHNHDAAYSAIGHNHNGVYATVSHSHAISDVTNLQTTLDGKASSTHNHDGTYQPDDADLDIYAGITAGTAIQSLLDLDNPSAIRFIRIESNNTASFRTTAQVLSDIGAAASGHNHDATYAAISHSHAISDVTNLQTTLDGKASTSHNHDGAYSAIGHNHDADYLDIAASTSDIEEGTNLYFTNERAQDALAAAIAAGTHDGIDITYNDVSNTLSFDVTVSGGSESTAWGNIPGTLSDQTDLQTALDGKASTSHNHDAAYSAIGHNHDGTYATAGHNHDGVYQPDDADLDTWAGITPGTGVGTFLATPSSVNLATAVTGETGSGALVFATSPTLTNPNLGTPSAITLTNGTGLPQSGVTNLTTDLAAKAPTSVTWNFQTGTSYTLVGADAYKIVDCTNAAAITLTIPPNGTEPFAVGTQITIRQGGAGQVTIAPGSGVTLEAPDSKLKTRAQYSPITLIKKATNTWAIMGDTAS